jgi:hypothetical protein
VPCGKRLAKVCCADSSIIGLALFLSADVADMRRLVILLIVVYVQETTRDKLRMRGIAPLGL